MFHQLVQDSVASFSILGWAFLAILILCLQIAYPKRSLLLVTSLLGTLGLIVYAVATFDPRVSISVFHGAAVIDAKTQIFNLIGSFTVLGVLLTLIAGCENKTKTFVTAYEQFPELLICLLFSLFGLGTLVSATDLSALFLGLETLSI